MMTNDFSEKDMKISSRFAYRYLFNFTTSFHVLYEFDEIQWDIAYDPVEHHCYFMRHRLPLPVTLLLYMEHRYIMEYMFVFRHDEAHIDDPGLILFLIKFNRVLIFSWNAKSMQYTCGLQ